MVAARERNSDWLPDVLERVRTVGYAVVEGVLTSSFIDSTREAMYRVQEKILRDVGKERLDCPVARAARVVFFEKGERPAMSRECGPEPDIGLFEDGDALEAFRQLHDIPAVVRMTGRASVGLDPHCCGAVDAASAARAVCSDP